jgi:radical SAM superfamily enzyme YgiQ (UPF0313 family)
MSELWLPEAHNGIRVVSDAHVGLQQFHLNEVAGAIWTLCDGTLTVAEIARVIALKCSGPIPPHGTVANDVLALLDALRAEGLIIWSDDEEVEVLLVVPPAPSVYAADAVRTPEYSAPPLGICYIAAVLREHGFHVAILDLHQMAGLPEDVITACRQRSPAIVGVTASTPSYPNAQAVARFVKAWRRECVTVLGGPHATGAPRDCVLSGAFDFVCVGEGEHAMLDLAQALLRGKGDPYVIPGFTFVGSQGSIGQSPPRPHITRLDDLPFPARDLIKLDDYYQKGSLVSSRGCSIGCNFCACAAIAGRSYRVHSIDRVLDEMEDIIQRHDYRYFDFHDDTFNLRQKRVFQFCCGIRARGLDAEWGCFCRAAQFTPEMAKAMVSAGCKVIQFGVESGNDAVLISLDKATSTAQVEAAVRAAAKAGVQQIACGFVIGHPNDTVESVRDTVRFGLRLRDLGATRLTLSLLTPYPGTPIYDNRARFGIRLLTDDWEQYTFSRVVMETQRLHREELRSLYVEGLTRFLDAARG